MAAARRRQRLPLPPCLPLLATCAIGAAVEFGWAAGEAVLVPFLARHGVRRWVVSTVYLANPALGLWAQPYLGAWSDGIGRRVPFVVALSSISLAGIVTLLAAVPLTKILGLAANGGDESVPAITVAVAFMGFGAADVCLDCLLVPGRALLDDLAAPAGWSGGGHALFTGFQLGGRLAALLAGSSRVTTSGLWGLYDSKDAHFDACLTASAIFLIGSTLAVVTFVDDRGSASAHDTIHSDSEHNSTEGCVADIEISSMHDDGRKLLQPTLSQEISSSHAGSSLQTGDIPSDQSMSLLSSLFNMDASVILCAVQAAGWVGVCAQSFFWTSWRGEEVGCMDLASQGVVGMATAGLLPHANAYFGTSSVWFASELFFHLLMISVAFASGSDGVSAQWWTFQQSGMMPRIISALTGVNYAVHATNGLIIAMDLLPDPLRRARTIAMVNNALPAGQLLTALSGGIVAQYFGGFEYALVCYGFAGSVVTSASWFISSRSNLFSDPIEG